MVTQVQKLTIESIVNIFESGAALGRYDAVVAAAGNVGHLSYGRSQVTLESGNLFALLAQYCAAPGCQFGAAMAPFMDRVRNSDDSLDFDMTFRGILTQAGADPVMQATQDAFFDSGFWNPASGAAASLGITSALGQAVVYDSFIHGGWAGRRDSTNQQVGTVAAVGEQAWVRGYMRIRRAWLAAGDGLLPVTVFRMDELMKLADANNWDLNLPFTVHDVRLDADVIGAGATAATSGTTSTATGPTPASSPAAAHSGFFLQGSFGTRGNFELVVPHPAGGLVHLSRLNDDPHLAWSLPVPFGQADGPVSGLTLLQSTFSSGGNKGSLEVVARIGDRMATYWRRDMAPFDWNGPFFVPPELLAPLSGAPAMVQGAAESKGNFEMVVPLAQGGFRHLWRNNGLPVPTWAKSVDIGAADGVFEALTMVQDRQGALQVIARHRDGRLLHYTRDATMPLTWHGPIVIPVTGLPAGVRPAGQPSLIQGRFGANGNYELVTPLSTGSLAHLSRINDDPQHPAWFGPVLFGADAGVVDGVSLIQSNFGQPQLGSLELIARSGFQVRHYWRSDAPPFVWSPATVLLS